MSGGFDRDSGTLSSFRRICDLASGGMGVVELAIREEGRFRRLYAVKRLRDSYRDDPEFREMFLEEARIAGLIRHPNVVSVLDVGEDASGPYLVMDYIEGASASALIQRAVAADTEVPMQVALRIVMDTAKGLHAAHELKDARGRKMELVHRDVSPQNLLVGFDGVTRVTDFGIAKAWGRTTQTATGVLKGKFGYLSPEQLRFDAPDRRSDLFSLGVVLYELLSGERLYKNRDGMDGARRILREPPPDLGEVRDDVPAELIELSFSMLAKQPEQRPPDALTVARKIDQVLAELVALEGPIEVSDFISEAFAEERRAQNERVQAAIASATGQLTLAEPSDAGDSAAAAQTQTEAGAPRGARLLPMIAIAGVLGVGAAVGVLLATGALGGPAPMPEISAEPAAAAGLPVDPDAGATPSSATAAALDSEGDALEGVTPPADSPEAASESESESQSQNTPSMTKRRPRRDMRRTATMGGMSAMGGGVPMWDWQ